MTLDKRLTPSRPDLAAEHLRGLVEAERFAPGIRRGIVASSAPLRRRPSPDAPLDTEALFGESLIVYEERDGWAWAQLERDSYVGYLPVSALGDPVQPSHKIATLRAHAYPGPSIKLPPLRALSYSAQVRIERMEGDFVVGHDGAHYWARHLASVGEVETDFVALARRFLGLPYLWGGRSSEGLDCSGLVQTALRATGVEAPRDSDMQEAELGAPLPPGAPLARGDLVFWRGHVGVMTDAATLLHANGFHMLVVEEPFAEACRRIEGKGGGPSHFGAQAMTRAPRISFIGAGSTVFMKNIVGDILQRPALAEATIALMDIDPLRLADSEAVARKIVATLGVPARIETHADRRAALDGADFVVTAFQIGGYDPCTITDFEVPKRYGLRHTIADTLGVGGIMRGLRTVPHLWAVCQDMMELCPKAILLQHVNPMAINTWAISDRFPDIRQVGLCHSVQGTAQELADDLDIPIGRIRYICAGINHMAFYLQFEAREADGSWRNLYPDLIAGYRAGRLPKADPANRCPNKVRYEMLTRLGHFVTESSEHFAEYTPYFIKRDRPDLIEKYGVPLDEYPKRCVEHIARWKQTAESYRKADRIEVEASGEYASSIVNSVWTGEPSVIYGNQRNAGAIASLPDDCATEVACLVDATGIHPTRVGALPPQLTALIRTNINVQELTVRALTSENREHIYHAAMMDPHTSAELDLDQIWSLVDDLIAAHGDWLPRWARK